MQFAGDRAQACLRMSPQQLMFILVQALLSLLFLPFETVVGVVEQHDTDTGGLLQKKRASEDERNFCYLIICAFWKEARKQLTWGSF